MAMRVLASLEGRRGLGRPSWRLSMASWISPMSISVMSLRTCHTPAQLTAALGTSSHALSQQAGWQRLRHEQGRS